MAGDPSVVRSVAVDVEDVVMALEANLRGEERTVLRVTPPFSGRMRARIHVVGPPDADATEPEAPVTVPPADLVADPPPYPRPDDTEDALRADPDAQYTPERHRERHVAALEEWRETIRDAIVETVTLEYGDREYEVAVTVLGGQNGADPE